MPPMPPMPPSVCMKCGKLILFRDGCAPDEFGCRIGKDPEECQDKYDKIDHNGDE